MKIKNHLLCLSIVILAGCANTNQQDSPYILNNQLSISHQNIDNSLQEQRGKLLFTDGQEANNCNAYFDLTSKYDLDESIHNQQVKSEYLICDALKILSNSPGLPTEKIKSLNLGEDLLSRLDLRSFPSSLNMASNETSHTLKSLYPEQTSSTGNVAELQTEDWAFTLEVVALARINDNLSPDWIVWILDESKSGNYRGYSTIILYDPEEHETFKATLYP